MNYAKKNALMLAWMSIGCILEANSTVCGDCSRLASWQTPNMGP